MSTHPHPQGWSVETEPEPLRPVSLRVNGIEHRVDLPGRRLLSDAQAHAFRYGASNATDINQSNPFKLPGWLTPLGEHGHNEQK